MNSNELLRIKSSSEKAYVGKRSSMLNRALAHSEAFLGSSDRSDPEQATTNHSYGSQTSIPSKVSQPNSANTVEASATLAPAHSSVPVHIEQTATNSEVTEVGQAMKLAAARKMVEEIHGESLEPTPDLDQRIGEL